MPVHQKSPSAHKRKRASAEEDAQSDGRLSPLGKKKVRWEGNTDVSEESSDSEEDATAAMGKVILFKALEGLVRFTRPLRYVLPQIANSKSRDLHSICLSCYANSGRVACAYYDPIKCMIYVLEDTQETLRFELTKMRQSFLVSSITCVHHSLAVLEQASPDLVLTSSKADDEFMDALRDHSILFS